MAAITEHCQVSHIQATTFEVHIFAFSHLLSTHSNCTWHIHVCCLAEAAAVPGASDVSHRAGVGGVQLLLQADHPQSPRGPEGEAPSQT